MQWSSWLLFKTKNASVLYCSRFFFVESEFLYFDRIWIFSESDAMNLLWEEGRLFLAKRRRLIADGAPSLHITHHVSASRWQWWWWWWNYYHHLHPASMIMECGCVRGGRGLKGVGKWAPNSIACCRQWPGSAWWSYSHGIQNISQSISGLLFMLGKYSKMKISNFCVYRHEVIMLYFSINWPFRRACRCQSCYYSCIYAQNTPD